MGNGFALTPANGDAARVCSDICQQICPAKVEARTEVIESNDRLQNVTRLGRLLGMDRVYERHIESGQSTLVYLNTASMLDACKGPDENGACPTITTQD